MKHNTKRFALAAVGALVAMSLTSQNAGAATVSVFFEDFEAGVDTAFTSVPGPGRVSSEGYSALGFGDFFLRNTSVGNPAASTVLTLAGLPTHTSIDLNFLLGIIDSWDGSATSVAPDLFNVEVDGISVFSETFDMFSAADQGYLPPAGVAISERVGRGFSGFADSAYNMGLDPVFDGIAHTASTLTIEFFASGSGWQGSTDESWGIDNVEVLLNGVPDQNSNDVPEPGALTLLGAGLAGLWVRRRVSVKRAWL